ncbi:MAG TPA: hypothetical protein VEJ20_02725, partial [Candidatus Eremiobacteraceae bacterium]|nr:hypothetical protein [Candidatus Eremiobacteraceae bacterium]
MNRIVRAAAAAIVTCCSLVAPSALRASVSAPPPLAVAVFASDPQEYGFGARHAVAQMGIPLVFTRDLNAALRQPMVIMTGATDGNFMSDNVTARLKQYIESGGVLVVDDGESAGVQQLAGIANLTPSEHRYSLHYSLGSGDPGLQNLRLAAEQTIMLGNKSEGLADLTQGYTLAKGTDAQTLATFDDGSVALVSRRIGAGRIYVTGLAYYDAVLRPQDDQALDAGRVYDNGFEPSADVPQFILRDWYLAFVRGAVVTDPTPDGLSGALLITHDIDYSKSVTNMLAYGRAEHAQHFTATYFIQAKTVRDIEDNAFFNAQAKQIISTVFEEGGDIASHTVAHAPDWRTFPVGTGKESPSTYHPFVKVMAPDHSHGLTLGASVTGEV